MKILESLPLERSDPIRFVRFALDRLEDEQLDLGWSPSRQVKIVALRRVLRLPLDKMAGRR